MIFNFIRKYFYLLLIVPYIVGAIGIGVHASRSLFLSLTPVILMFNFALLLIEEDKWLKNHRLALISIGVLSILAEYLGTNFGILFGNYTYGNILGLAIGGVPVIIGVNWIMVVSSSLSLSHKLQLGKWPSIGLAAVFATVFDFLLEPVAIKYDWWQWQGNAVPVFNYLTWFALAFVFSAAIYNQVLRSKRGGSVLVIQALFFIYLLWL